MPITPYIRNGGFSRLFSPPIDDLSLLGRNGHMPGCVCFNAFLGLGKYIFKKKESQIWTSGFYIIF